MNVAVNGKVIPLNVNGKVKTMADLDTICELMALSLTGNANQTMTVDKQGPFTLAQWQDYANPYGAEGLDEFRLVPDRWHDKAIAMVRKHVADNGPSAEACDLIYADRIAELNS